MWSPWIENKGVVPGLPDDTDVEVVLRDGSKDISSKDKFRWAASSFYPERDIIKYRYRIKETSRIDIIGQNGNDGLHYPKQERYKDDKGEDWIDECARTFTADEFRGAMMFTIGKYIRRCGKKDSIISEVTKIADYSQRWAEYERGRPTLLPTEKK